MCPRPINSSCCRPSSTPKYSKTSRSATSKIFKANSLLMFSPLDPLLAAPSQWHHPSSPKQLSYHHNQWLLSNKQWRKSLSSDLCPKTKMLVANLMPLQEPSHERPRILASHRRPITFQCNWEILLKNKMQSNVKMTSDRYSK